MVVAMAAVAMEAATAAVKAAAEMAAATAVAMVVVVTVVVRVAAMAAAERVAVTAVVRVEMVATAEMAATVAVAVVYATIYAKDHAAALEGQGVSARTRRKRTQRRASRTRRLWRRGSRRQWLSSLLLVLGVAALRTHVCGGGPRHALRHEDFRTPRRRQLMRDVHRASRAVWRFRPLACKTELLALGAPDYFTSLPIRHIHHPLSGLDASHALRPGDALIADGGRRRRLGDRTRL